MHGRHILTRYPDVEGVGSDEVEGTLSRRDSENEHCPDLT